MELDARAKLLRERLRAIRPSAGAAIPKATRRPAGTEPTRTEFRASLGNATAWKWGKTEWIQAADPVPKAAPRTMRNGGVPALTIIAAKAPKKLVRFYQNAEMLLAARVRRGRL
jgi:hypothetical protein